MPWKEAILTVLRDVGEDMHYTAIAAEIRDRHLRSALGNTPSGTVGSLLSTSLKDSVVKVQPGVYKLRDGADAVPVPTPTADELPETPQADEPDEEMGLINAFGMYWLRSEVDWKKGSNTKLYGENGGDPIDFSQQAGVYILYNGDRVMYVGRATNGRMGSRLSEHTRDRTKARWDRFSWFGVRPVREDGLGEINPANLSFDTLLASMEALMIEGLEPPQNRRGGDKVSTVEYMQATDPAIQASREKALMEKVMGRIKMT